MSVEVEDREGVLVAHLGGSLDSRSAPEIVATLQDLLAGTPCLVLELGGLTYMSSTGLRVLLLLDRAARRAGHRFVTVGAPAQIHEVMVATGLLDHLQTAASVDDALTPAIS